MKRVEKKELKAGLKVVTNERPDTQVYTVGAVEGLGASVYYYAGGVRRDGGWLDRSMMLHPSKEQLANVQ